MSQFNSVMWVWLILVAHLCLTHSSDLEFDEFKDFEDDDFKPEKLLFKEKEQASEEIEKAPPITQQTVPPKKKPSITQLKINQVSMHFRSNWNNYYVEMILLLGLFVYLVNYLTGRSRNHYLAMQWYKQNKDIFESNFALIGNHLTTNSDLETLKNKTHSDDDDNCPLLKDSDNIYLLWASGHPYCEALLVEIKFLKRQDLASYLFSSFINKDTDKMFITVYMNADEMDSYVFAIGNKKCFRPLVKDMKDLSLYCPEKKNGEKLGLPNNTFQFVSEIGEAILAFVDPKIQTIFAKYENYIDYVHVSDQFAGKKSPDETSPPTKLGDVKKCLRFGFTIPSDTWNKDEAINNLRPLLNFVFYSIEKVQRFRLSKEAKMKSVKNRAKLEESLFRQSHSQRVEAAQARKEEKRRADKQRLENEQDPLKQKKLQEKEYKRELKKRNPKFKQLKIRAM